MTRNRLHAAQWGTVVPVVVAVLQAVLVLGPALGRGVAITHDMAWSPLPTWTPFVLGVDTPAPRAVPSDAAMVLLGKLLGASMAQTLVLLAILVGLALGAVALLDEVSPGSGVLGRCVAAIVAVWNPFVFERLAVGQWVVVLGLAVTPWAIRASLRRWSGRGSRYAVALTLAVAAIGGVNALAVVGAVVLLMHVGAALRDRSRARWRDLGVVLAVIAGLAAVWALPVLGAPSASRSSAGVDEFAPTADSPVGVLGSLLAGGGFWNSGTHPDVRQSLVVGVVSAALMVLGVGACVGVLRTRRTPLVLALGMLGLLVLVSAVEPLRGLWSALVSAVPGGGALRDSQKYMAAWVAVAAAGAGVVADRLRSRVPAPWQAPEAALLVALPILMSPQLAWGLGGRLDAVSTPDGFATGVGRLAQLPPGDVGLLPWSQYRRYGWNDSRLSLTIAPRVIDRVVLFDDALPLRSGTVAGESPRAAAVSAAVAAGQEVEAAIAAQGVRYVAAELDAGPGVDVERLRAAGQVVVDTPQWLVVDVGGSTVTSTGSVWGRLGWGISLVTFSVVLLWRGVRHVTPKLPASLLRSRT